jgi:integrase
MYSKAFSHSRKHKTCSAIQFQAQTDLYRYVLHQPLDDRIDAVRAKRSRSLPTVLTPEEAQSVIQQLSGVHRLIVQLLYGSGLRLREAMQLRVKDIDFPQHQIVVRDTKGHESRVTVLPTSVIEPLQDHLCTVAIAPHHNGFDASDAVKV